MAIKNVIFDMDGVLIDSEPFWAEAQIETLKNCGISISEPDCEKYTRGVRIDELVQIWIDLFKLSVEGSQLKQQILDYVCAKISRDGVAMEGIYELLTFLQQKNIRIALATSSDRRVIKAVFDRLGLWDYFSVQCTAAEEELAKPNPAVYLTAVKKLNARLNETIIIEDSVVGLIAAKAANVRTFIVNPKFSNEKFALAEHRVASLLDLLAILKTEL
ncbi:MAG TPA: HAD family hydrolase [Pasteurellaceae bacterium]|nr:HAD family hydrolase [Pasteurellaceae bacterium]